jgi:hypothetical protein
MHITSAMDVQQEPYGACDMRNDKYISFPWNTFVAYILLLSLFDPFRP